jgi:hypothetical protein
VIAFLKKLVGLTPKVAMQAHAVHLNPSHGQHVDRHRQRVARLRQAIAESPKGEYRNNLQAELDRRLATMKAAGLEV